MERNEELPADRRSHMRFPRANDTSLIDLAKAVKHIRIRSGMTQAELAKAIGASQGNIARLESGQHAPSVRVLQNIATATHSRLSIDFNPLPRRRFEMINTTRRHFLGGAAGLAGLLGFGPIREISAQEATAAATAVGDYVWTPPQYDPEPALFNVIGENGETVIIETIDGEVEVPTNPQRIVALGWEYISLFELGITDPVVGVSFYEMDDPPLRKVGDLTESMHSSLSQVTLIPNPFDLDIEQVVLLEPDLILTGPWVEDPSSLMQLAPTVRGVTAALNVPRAAVRDFGAMVGHADTASELFSEHGAFVTRAKEAIASSVSGKKAVAIAVDGESIWVMPSYYLQNDEVYAYGSGPYQLHRELGITPPSFIEYLADQDGRASAGLSFSVEQIREIDADYIFVLDEAGSYDAFISNPLVEHTIAGQQDHIYPFNAVSYGFGLAGIRAGISYIVECITGTSFS